MQSGISANQGDFDTHSMIIIGIVVILFSFIFIGVSIIIKAFGNRKRTICSVLTRAEVISFVSERRLHGVKRDPRMRELVTPLVRYFVNGFEVRAHSNVYMKPCPYKIGDMISIRYNPEKPDQMMLDNNSTTKIICTVFLLVGIIISLVGFIVLLMGCIL